MTDTTTPSQTSNPSIIQKAEIVEALKHLFQLNRPEVIAPILGWVVACHLKPQIMRLYSQFPLLFLWGGKGSGKTQTMRVMRQLHGVDEALNYLACNSITEAALKRTLCSTATVPTVFEEFDKAWMGLNKFARFGELFCAAFNESAVELSEGILYEAAHNEVVLTAPVCVISERAVTRPGLVERGCKVRLIASAINGRISHLKYLQEHPQGLLNLAKVLAVGAPRVEDSWVRNNMHALEPEAGTALSSRQVLVRQVGSIGLAYLDTVLLEFLQLDLSCKINNLQQQPPLCID